MTSFTPFSALAGGALIGLAATLLLWLNGRVAGISGIVGGILRGAPGEVGWRAAFVAGLVLGGGAVAVVHPVSIGAPGGSVARAVVAGLLVGAGTCLGNGCTSGHGVCGISRVAGRSIAATMVFMASGMLAAWVVLHAVGGAS